ncbi:MAG TPA: hypothetical protein VHC40_08205 [Rhizomicrobium sp.]|nr:hypothetical protein [Rhizomicrobium sp.]
MQRLERHWTGLALVAAAVMLAAPLWCVTSPAMPDYPAHLASFWLIGGGDGGAFYRVAWSFVPNLASEILVPLLARLTGLAAAAKLFLTASVFLWVLGPGAVHRALYGRTGIAPLLGAFFAYNANFIWGFFNYDFATGLAFAIFAAWIATEDRNGPVRLAGFAAAVTALYFCHIFAAATLALMLAGFEAAQNVRLERHDPAALARRAARILALYMPAALAFLFLKPHGADEAGIAFNLADTMIDRFESLIQHAFDEPAYTLPAILFGGLMLALALRRARLHPAMWGVLALLLAGALCAPEWAMGGWGVHMRLPAVFGAMLFASAELRMSRPLRAAVMAVALVTAGWTATALARNWRGYDAQYREFNAVMAQIPRGSRLLTVLDGNAIGERSDQPYWHMAEFAVPARGAFTPLMFTTVGQHVVQLKPPYRHFAAATAAQGSPPDLDDLDFLARGQADQDEDIQEIFPYLLYFQCHFDIAVVVHLDGKRSPVPSVLRLRYAGRAFSLYDIRPDQACAGR